MPEAVLSKYKCLVSPIDQEHFVNTIKRKEDLLKILQAFKEDMLNELYHDVDTYHVLLVILFSAGRIKEVQQIAEAKRKKFPSLEAELLIINTYVYENNISYGQWESKFEKFINDFKNQNKPRSLAVLKLLYINGLTQIWNKFKETIEYLPEIFNTLNELIAECKHARIYEGIANSFGAWAYYQLGNLNKASDYLSKAYEIIEESEDPIEIIRILHLRLLIFGELGHAKKSIEEGHTLIKLRENIGDFRGVSTTMNNLALQYWSIGELKKAEALLEKSIKIFEENVGRPPILPLLNLTTIYITSEEYEKAYKMAMKALEISKKTNITHPGIPASVARVLIAMKKYDEAEKYLNELKKLAEERKSDRYLSEYYFLKGTLDMEQMDFKSAEDAFIKSLELSEPLNLLSEIVDAHIKIAEIALNKYKITNNEADLQKARKHLYYAKKECEEQDLERQLIQIIQMEAILDKLAGKHEHAESLINDALKRFAEEHHKRLHETLQDIRKARSAKDRSRLFDSFFKHTRNFLKFAVTRRLKKINYKVLGYIIMTRSSGISIASKMYDKKLTTDSDLVAGVISAVSSFITEISKDEGLLRSIVHENISILLDYDNNYIYALLTDKDTYAARRLLERIKNEFNKAYNIDINTWDGNLKVFKQASDVVNKIIEEAT